MMPSVFFLDKLAFVKEAKLSEAHSGLPKFGANHSEVFLSK